MSAAPAASPSPNTAKTTWRCRNEVSAGWSSVAGPLVAE